MDFIIWMSKGENEYSTGRNGSAQYSVKCVSHMSSGKVAELILTVEVKIEYNLCIILHVYDAFINDTIQYSVAYFMVQILDWYFSNIINI